MACRNACPASATRPARRRRSARTAWNGWYPCSASPSTTFSAVAGPATSDSTRGSTGGGPVEQAAGEVDAGDDAGVVAGEEAALALKGAADDDVLVGAAG